MPRKKTSEAQRTEAAMEAVREAVETRDDGPVPGTEGSVGERLWAILEDEGLLPTILQTVARKAADGDLRAVQYVLDLLGSEAGVGHSVIRVEWAPGLEELAK